MRGTECSHCLWCLHSVDVVICRCTDGCCTECIRGLLMHISIYPMSEPYHHRNFFALFFFIFFCVGVPQGCVLSSTLFFFYIQCFALLVSQWDGTLTAVCQQNNFAPQSQQPLFS